jgi:N6-adenosine-specific RNA methylase IME4
MKRYGTILADPAWPYKRPRAIGPVNVLNHYPTMPLHEIMLLPVEDLVADQAHLYLWATNAFLCEAHDVSYCWGFEPVNVLTWVKIRQEGCHPSMKAGLWYRSATEHIVFGVRGKLRLAGPAAPTAYLLPREAHSRKPDFFYDLIERQSPGPYLELFARRSRPGWDRWGEEVDSTIAI